MEGRVKFFLGEGVPILLHPFGGAAGVAAFTWESFVTTKPFRHVIDGPPPPKQLIEELISHCNIKNIEFRITMSSRSGKNKTNFRLEYSQGWELKTFFRGYEGFLQIEVHDKERGQGFITQEMAVVGTSRANKDPLKFTDFVYNAKLDNLLRDAKNQVIHGTMNFILTAKYYSKVDKLAVNKRILRDEITTDVVIIPSNGVEVKCHRSFLAAQSIVFQAMFQGSMKEATSGRIEMPHMSEEGVRALLAYLYHWDESKAHDSCSVALELLEAGHSYNISLLEKAMRKLLLSKPVPWYKVEVSKDLFHFVQNLDGDEWKPLKISVIMKK